MNLFSNKLEVGMQAMIINTTKPENKSLIGKIIRIEAILEVGDDISEFYLHKGKVIENYPIWVICSGVSAPVPCTSANGAIMIPNHARFKKEHLMPIPPLEEKEQQKEVELRCL